ncbi:MAG: hypothetical protein ACFFEN_10260 [Candidatus Thorarchaeota archaeon]
MGKNLDQSIVTIKPLAYYKMLLHVLRFGSKYLDHSNLSEVMGVLIGHLEGEGDVKDVIVEDVVPVSHGGTIEVKFSVEQLGAFGEIDGKIFEHYGDAGWFSVGWYHSHPGLGIFFSETDKFNQIFWQKNPYGIGIVFDHTYLEKPGDLGFRIFRLNETNLDDPSVAMKSDYHEVKAKVEAPNSGEYYLKIMGLINKVHTRSPHILELNETIDLFCDVFIPEEEQILAKLPEINFEKIINAMKSGMETFLEISIKPLLYLLNSWSQETVNKISTNNFQMRNDLKDLRDRLSSELIHLQQSFNYDLQNDLRDLDFFVDDKLEELDIEKEKIKELTNKSVEAYHTHIDNLFEKRAQEIFSNLLNKIENTAHNLSNFEQNFSDSIKNLELGMSRLNALAASYKSVDKLMESEINSAQEGTSSIFVNKVNKVKGNLSNLGKDTKGYLSDLKAAIILLESSKDPIESKLKTLQSENKELQKSIKDLKSEKQDLQNRIKKLEKEVGK